MSDDARWMAAAASLAARGLPPAPILRDVPQSTPLIRHHPAYAHAFRLIQSHFQSYRVQLDDEHLVTRARSLPVLYEWWCLLAVLRFLQGELKQLDTTGSGRGTPFRRLRDERERFVATELAGQFRQVIVNTLAILGEDGAGPEHIVRMTCYVTDLDAYRAGLAEIGAAWRELIGRHFPSMAVVGVAGLVEPAALIEVETMAVVPE